MLTELTQEQKDLIPSFIEYGLKMGLSTERTNRPKAEQALKDHYVACGLKEPKVKWLDSPWNFYFSPSTRPVWDSVRLYVVIPTGELIQSSISNPDREFVLNSISNSVWAVVRSALPDSVRISIGAFSDSPLISCWLACDTYGIALPKTAYTYMKVCEEVFWFYPTKDTVFVSDRPVKIARDNEGRSHCETGKAMFFSNGDGISSWHGQKIPDEWVTGNPPSPQECLTWSDMDQRAAACEIVGWHHILDALDATVIDDSHDPLWGRLVEVTLPDSGQERFLDALCGTGRRFALPVPPTVNTVDEAQSALHGGIPAPILRNYERRT